MVGRFGEDQAIKSTVEDIAERSGEDQGKTGQETERGLVLDEVIDVVAQKTNGEYPEQAERQLAVFAAERQTEGHAVVLDKVDTGPTHTEDKDLVAVLHMGFYPDLDDLIE